MGERAKHCSRHYQQMIKWGECRFSRGDKNQYILHDDFAEVILHDKYMREKARAVIDIEDIEKCKPYKWTLRNDGYVATKKNYKHIKLHRFIASTPIGLHTDHIDRDRLNNRKENLRICTQQENNKNKSLYSNNKSGFTGVEVVEGSKGSTYLARINFEGRSYHIGCYDTLEKAIRERKKTEVEFYGYELEE